MAYLVAMIRGLRAFSGGCHGEEFMLALLTRQRDMLKTERVFNTLREYVAGARRALKTWRMTRWRQPGFYRHERTLPRIRSGFGVKVRAVDCSAGRFTRVRSSFCDRFVRRRPVTR